jgi:hypothetical protein
MKDLGLDPSQSETQYLQANLRFVAIRDVPPVSLYRYNFQGNPRTPTAQFGVLINGCPIKEKERVKEKEIDKTAKFEKE